MVYSISLRDEEFKKSILSYNHVKTSLDKKVRYHEGW